MKIKYGSDGLIPFIAQDALTGAVLSLFYANEEAITRMNETGFVWRYSRSKKRLMQKGEESGNTMKVVSMAYDCDSDALLVQVEVKGPACHTGTKSCFGDISANMLEKLAIVIRDRKLNPKKDSYTSSIVNDRDKIVEKLREECEELIDAKEKDAIRWEAADLLYFMLLYLENCEVSFEAALTELKRRRK